MGGGLAHDRDRALSLSRGGAANRRDVEFWPYHASFCAVSARFQRSFGLRLLLVNRGVGSSAVAGCGGSSGDGPFPDAQPPADGNDFQPPDAGDAGGVDATLPDGSRGDGGVAGDTAAAQEAASEAGDAAANDADSDAPILPALEAGACGDPFGGGPLPTSGTHLDIGVHDPSMIWDGYRYFLFATGRDAGRPELRRHLDVDGHGEHLRLDTLVGDGHAGYESGQPLGA